MLSFRKHRITSTNSTWKTTHIFDHLIQTSLDFIHGHAVRFSSIGKTMFDVVNGSVFKILVQPNIRSISEPMSRNSTASSSVFCTSLVPLDSSHAIQTLGKTLKEKSKLTARKRRQERKAARKALNHPGSLSARSLLHYSRSEDPHQRPRTWSLKWVIPQGQW